MSGINAKTISQIVCNSFEIKSDLENYLSESLSREKLQIIANSDPYLLDNQVLLLGFYTEIKKTWPSAIVNRIKTLHKLNLRQKLDRCILAVAAATEKIARSTKITALADTQINDSPTVPDSNQPSALVAKVKQLERLLETTSVRLVETEDRLLETTTELEHSKNQLNKQIKLNIIVATDRLLPQGLPLNGVQNSPAMKIMGSPTTLTRLELNYRILDKKWLDKIKQYNEWIKELLLGEESEKYWNQETIDLYSQKKREAVERYKLIRSIYELLAPNWDVLKPTIPISDEEKAARMNGKIPHGWSPESFWE